MWKNAFTQPNSPDHAVNNQGYPAPDIYHEISNLPWLIAGATLAVADSTRMEMKSALILSINFEPDDSGAELYMFCIPRVTLTDYTAFPSDTHEVLSTSSRASSVNDSDSGINLTTDEEKEAAGNGQHRSRLAKEEKQESSASPSPSPSSSFSSSSSFSYSKISNPLIRQISLEIREASLLRGNSRQHCARITGILLPGAGNSVSRQIQRSITDLDNTQLEAADDDEDCPLPAVVGVCSPPLRPPVEITEVSEDSADVQVGELCLDELYQSMVGEVRR
ncbi:unnamed protein product [Dibothriocephalus latus]|uniref:Uncharacterized protein n=1 Tax=Dibothriocephalus latus TaxID=60516 RepID=A0A3P7KVB3_DIBLA|nr:unnamed protein product [Dibothriocephalus latus]